jgi:hypothetical protein
MKIYLAAWYERNAEMRAYRDVLENMGHRVTSRWIDQHEGELPQSMGEGVIAEHVDAAAKYALKDLQDIVAADMLVHFTSPGFGKGGRHIEFGYALALRLPIALVGPRENVFHALPGVTWYPDWETFISRAFLPF